MIEFAFTFFLIVFELIYIAYAKGKNWVDNPNSRSSHHKPIVRGGGIIIFFAIAISSFLYLQYIWLGVGITILGIIGIIDDITGLNQRIRLIGQAIAVLAFFIILPTEQISLVTIILLVIVAVGMVNTMNFMDGINGITIAYSLVMLGTIYYMNDSNNLFPDRFFIWPGISLLVFAFFNFRNTALSFAGDIGSTAIGYLLVFLTFYLILSEHNLSYILLWSVYGIDSVLTVVHRILKRENIFKAHRSHLYQYYANELGSSHLSVATFYGLIQGIINVLFIINIRYQFVSQLIFTILILSGSGLIYLLLRSSVVRKLKLINQGN